MQLLIQLLQATSLTPALSQNATNGTRVLLEYLSLKCIADPSRSICSWYRPGAYHSTFRDQQCEHILSAEKSRVKLLL